MAIYSCNLSSIGKTTHQGGTAGAHIRYIARADAQPELLAEHMPDDPRAARTWMDNAERDMRKNGRVIDKIRLALPRELDEVQRAQLVQDFMADLSGDNRVPWFAAIHQTGKDAHNPHAHIAVHDRDLETGRRVLRLSDSTRDRIKAGLPGPKAVEWIRERWEAVGNRALARAGIDARIDRRSLEAQGVDRKPTIHEGPRAQHINDNVKRPDSKPITNGAGRVIDYPAIDKGRTRREFNAQIIDFNLARAARAANPETAAWAGFEKDQLAKDRALESQLAADRRQRTAALRAASAKYTAQRKRAGAELRLKTRQAVGQVRDRFQPRRTAMRARHADQRQALRSQQKGLMARIARRLSRTVKDRHLAARVSQIEAHRAERQLLSQTYRQAKAQARDALTARYSAQYEKIRARRSAHLSALKERHGQAENFADHARQQREAEREQARQLTESKIQGWKRGQRNQTGQEDKPARSRLEKGWSEKGKLTPEARAAAARKRMEEAEHKRTRDQRRRRKRGRD